MRADLQSEMAAVSSYLRLLSEAEECQRLYIRAGLALPEKLIKLLGDEVSPLQTSFGPPSPETDLARNATRPPQANQSWLSIKSSSAAPTTVTLALMRDQTEPLKARDLADKVTRVLPTAVGGSIYNLLNRLEADGTVVHDEDGWMLANEDSPTVMSGDYLWGPPNKFTKTDLAAHRREAIMALLHNERHLQVMPIVRKLHDWPWVKAPVNKDLVKGDMTYLESEGLIRRIGNSRNWEAVQR